VWTVLELDVSRLFGAEVLKVLELRHPTWLKKQVLRRLRSSCRSAVSPFGVR
jgi:hypothetical protein